MTSFSFDTIQDFDLHIKSSIPRYEDIHKCIDGINQYFIKDNYKIYDIGCSTGSLLTRISHNYSEKNLTLIGIDKSDNLIGKDNRVSSSEEAKIRFINGDILNEKITIENADIVYSIFTLCFIPYKFRESVLRKIFSGMNFGGVLIVTDKIYASNSKIQDIYTFLYYDFKKNYFSNDEILDKEKDLREIQMPLSSSENIELLRKVGFKKIDSFWKYFNFQGYIAIK